MRISDWSSDVCSSDLPAQRRSGGPDCAKGHLPHGSRGGRGSRTRAVPDGRWLSPHHARRGHRYEGPHHEKSWARGRTYAGRHIQWRSAQSRRSEEHTSELQSLMRISYAVFCLKKKIQIKAIEL